MEVVDSTIITSCMTSIQKYIEIRTLAADPSKVTLLNRKASEYMMIIWVLYKGGLSTPLLKCLGNEEVVFVILEVHKWMV